MCLFVINAIFCFSFNQSSERHIGNHCRGDGGGLLQELGGLLLQWYNIQRCASLSFSFAAHDLLSKSYIGYRGDGVEGSFALYLEK